jgi:hypothetical protein
MKILAALLSLVGCTPADSMKPRLIHVPKNGCPRKSRLVKNVFIEKDGTREDGCLFGSLDGATGITIDVLKPGESVVLGVGITDEKRKI